MAYSGLTPEQAHRVLSWMEDNVISMILVGQDGDFEPGRDGTTIGDMVLNIIGDA